MRPRVKHFLAEFEQILSEDKEVEEIRATLMIRIKVKGVPCAFCPITYVYHRRLPSAERLSSMKYHRAANVLGMNDSDAEVIVASADYAEFPGGSPENFDPEVRRRLLEITSLCASPGQ